VEFDALRELDARRHRLAGPGERLLAHELGNPERHWTGLAVLGRRCDELLGDRPPFRLVAVEELGRCPAVDDACELPADVDGVTDAGVAAVTTPWRVLVSGVTRDEEPSETVGVRDKGACVPRVCRDHAHGYVKPDQLLDDELWIGLTLAGLIWARGRDRPPGALEIESVDDAGRSGVQDPVLHGVAVGHQLA